MNAQRNLIDAIRRSWGIGLQDTGDADTNAAIGNLRHQLGNALKLVSDQLYSSESHFLLELLQNADDNDYPDDVVPTFSFQIAPQYLTFHYNEVGFTRDDVRALCGIGESTKKGKKAVKTGEKGIGFKAVFKISNRPEVHSNGFHFGFNREAHGELGLVIPDWIETPSSPEPGAGTRIVLPLRADVEQDFDLVTLLRPELLVFLRRLRLIRGQDARSGAIVDLTRSDQDHIVEINRRIVENGPTEPHRFYIHRRTVNVENLTDDLRADLRETDVVVALPLAVDNAADASTPREVFSFLPVATAGFRFVAHADFVLNTSREAVIKNRPWNIRLRNELGVALSDAILGAKAVAPLGRSALRFLTPPRDIADEFMRRVLTVAIDELKGAECVPTGDRERSKPDAVVRPDSAGLSTLIDDDELARLLGKRYVAGDVAGLAGPLDLLGCERFELKHVLKCCQSPEWLEGRPTAWVAQLLTLLAKLPSEGGHLAELRDAPILRLANGKSVTPASGTVFRSLGGRLVYGFEGELRILDKAVLDAVPAEDGALVRRFLAQLDVREPEPQHVIDGHILQLHRGQEWKKCTKEAQRGHVRYVRDHLDDYLKAKGDAGAQDAALTELRQHLWLRTSSQKDGHGWVSHAPFLYLSRPYADPYDLHSLFGDRIAESLVEPGYVQGTDTDSKAKDATAWSEFLQRLGAHVLPRMLLSNLPPSHITLTSHTRRAGPAQVTDWRPSEEFQELIQARDPEKKVKLLSVLGSAWTTSLARYARGHAQWPYAPQNFDSTWLIMLRKMEVQTIDGGWVPIQSTFLATKENRAVFGTGVPYIAASLFRSRDRSREFLDAVEVVVQPEVEQVIERLDQIRSDANVDNREIRRLYKYLDQQFEENDKVIAEAFAIRQIVYLPDQRSWATLANCCWDVPASVRRFAPVPGLNGPWRDLEEFFCEKLDVRRHLTADEWVQTLRGLAASDLPPEEIGDLARQIYRRLNDFLKDSQAGHPGKDPKWIPALRAEALLWTTKREWWQNEEDVLVADDPTLQQFFEASTRIAFIDIPSAERPRFARLLEAAGVPALSERIDVVERPPASARRAAPELEERLRERWLHLATLLFHKYVDAYNSAVLAGLLKQFRSLPAYVCDPLTLVVEVCGERAQARFDARILADQEGLALFVDQSSSQNWDPISMELGRLLELDDGASLTIARVFTAASTADIEKLFGLLRVPPIPNDEGRKLLGEESELADAEAWTSGLGNDGSAQDTPDFLEGDDSQSSGAEACLPEAPTTRSIVSPVSSAANGPAIGSTADGNPGAPTTTEKTPPVPQVDADAKQSLSRAENSALGPADDAAPPVGPKRPTTGPSQFGTNAEGTVRGDAPTGDRQSSLDNTATLPSPPIRPDSADRPRASGTSENRRLISYVGTSEAAHERSERGARAQEHRDQVDQAAIEFVIADEESEPGRKARVMPHNNKGYDIESACSEGEVDRYIEVKGLGSQWSDRGVTLTAAEFEFARSHSTSFWLYVVEYAGDPHRCRLHRIHNPIAQITHFGFDEGWRATAESERAELDDRRMLREGARYRMPDGREGFIHSITRHGQIIELKLTLSDGTTVLQAGPEDQLTERLMGEA